MPIVEKHAPGDFCWMELATTDHAAAKKFYSELFPWSFTEFPIGPDELYTMFKVDGRDVGAAYTLRAEQQKQGIPAHWNLYVAVENAEAAVSRALELGAKLLASPLDVFDAGRMDVLEDPTGAAFSVWQAKRHTGFGIKGVPATFCVADLSTGCQPLLRTAFWMAHSGRKTNNRATTTTISSTTTNSLQVFSRPRFAIRRRLPIGKFICRCPIAMPSPPKPKILARNSSCRRWRLKISDASPCWRIPKALYSRSSKPRTRIKPQK